MLTQHPFHDEKFCPGELSGFDPENLAWVICDGLIGEILHSLKTVWSIQHEQAQEDGEGDSMSHKLHKGTAKNLTQLEEREGIKKC